MLCRVVNEFNFVCIIYLELILAHIFLYFSFIVFFVSRPDVVRVD